MQVQREHEQAARVVQVVQGEQAEQARAAQVQAKQVQIQLEALSSLARAVSIQRVTIAQHTAAHRDSFLSGIEFLRFLQHLECLLDALQLV